MIYYIMQLFIEYYNLYSETSIDVLKGLSFWVEKQKLTLKCSDLNLEIINLIENKYLNSNIYYLNNDIELLIDMKKKYEINNKYTITEKINIIIQNIIIFIEKIIILINKVLEEIIGLDFYNNRLILGYNWYKYKLNYNLYQIKGLSDLATLELLSSVGNHSLGYLKYLNKLNISYLPENKTTFIYFHNHYYNILYKNPFNLNKQLLNMIPYSGFTGFGLNYDLNLFESKNFLVKNVNFNILNKNKFLIRAFDNTKNIFKNTENFYINSIQGKLLNTLNINTDFWYSSKNRGDYYGNKFYIESISDKTNPGATSKEDSRWFGGYTYWWSWQQDYTRAGSGGKTIWKFTAIKGDLVRMRWILVLKWELIHKVLVPGRYAANTILVSLKEYLWANDIRLKVKESFFKQDKINNLNRLEELKILKFSKKKNFLQTYYGRKLLAGDGVLFFDYKCNSVDITSKFGKKKNDYTIFFTSLWRKKGLWLIEIYDSFYYQGKFYMKLSQDKKKAASVVLGSPFEKEFFKDFFFYKYENLLKKKISKGSYNWSLFYNSITNINEKLNVTFFSKNFWTELDLNTEKMFLNKHKFNDLSKIEVYLKTDSISNLKGVYISEESLYIDKYLVKNTCNYINIIKYNVLKKKIEYNYIYQYILTNIIKPQVYNILDFMEKVLTIIYDHLKKSRSFFLIALLKKKVLLFFLIALLVFGIYGFLCFELLLLLKSVIPKDLIINIKASKKSNNLNVYKKYIQFIISNIEQPYHSNERSFYSVWKEHTFFSNNIWGFYAKNKIILGQYNSFYNRLLFEKNIKKYEDNTKIRGSIKGWFDFLIKFKRKSKNIVLLRDIGKEYRDKMYNMNHSTIWKDNLYDIMPNFLILWPSVLPKVFYVIRYIFNIVKFFNLATNTKWKEKKIIVNGKETMLTYSSLRLVVKQELALFNYKSKFDLPAQIDTITVGNVKDQLYNWRLNIYGNMDVDDSLINKENLKQKNFSVKENIKKFKETVTENVLFWEEFNNWKAQIKGEKTFLEIEQDLIQRIKHKHARAILRIKIKEEKIDMEMKLKIERSKFIIKSNFFKIPRALEKVVQKQKTLIEQATADYNLRLENFASNKKDLLLDAKDEEYYNKCNNYKIDLKNNLFLLEKTYKTDQRTSDLNTAVLKQIYNYPIEDKFPMLRWYSTIGARLGYVKRVIITSFALCCNHFNKMSKNEYNLKNLYKIVYSDIQKYVLKIYWEYIFIFNKYIGFKKKFLSLRVVLHFALFIMVPLFIYLGLLYMLFIMYVSYLVIINNLKKKMNKDSVIYKIKIFIKKNVLFFLLSYRFIFVDNKTKLFVNEVIYNTIYYFCAKFEKNVFFIKNAFLKGGLSLALFLILLKVKVYIKKIKKNHIYIVTSNWDLLLSKSNKLLYRIYWELDAKGLIKQTYISIYKNIIEKIILSKKILKVLYKIIFSIKVKTKKDKNIKYGVIALVKYIYIYILKLTLKKSIIIFFTLPIMPIIWFINFQKKKYVTNRKQNIEGFFKNPMYLLISIKTHYKTIAHKVHIYLYKGYISRYIYSQKESISWFWELFLFNKAASTIDFEQRRDWEYLLAKYINLKQFVLLNIYNVVYYIEEIYGEIHDNPVYRTLSMYKRFVIMYKVVRARMQLNKIKKNKSRNLLFLYHNIEKKKYIKKYIYKSIINWLSFRLWNDYIFYSKNLLKKKKIKYKYLHYDFSDCNDALHVSDDLEGTTPEIWLLPFLYEYFYKLILYYYYGTSQPDLFDPYLIKSKNLNVKWKISSHFEKLKWGMQGILGITEDDGSGEVLYENLVKKPYDGTLRYIFYIIERFFAREGYSDTKVWGDVSNTFMSTYDKNISALKNENIIKTLRKDLSIEVKLRGDLTETQLWNEGSYVEEIKNYELSNNFNKLNKIKERGKMFQKGFFILDIEPSDEVELFWEKEKERIFVENTLVYIKEFGLLKDKTLASELFYNTEDYDKKRDLYTSEGLQILIYKLDFVIYNKNIEEILSYFTTVITKNININNINIFLKPGVNQGLNWYKMYKVLHYNKDDLFAILDEKEDLALKDFRKKKMTHKKLASIEEKMKEIEESAIRNANKDTREVVKWESIKNQVLYLQTKRYNLVFMENFRKNISMDYDPHNLIIEGVDYGKKHLLDWSNSIERCIKKKKPIYLYFLYKSYLDNINYLNKEPLFYINNIKWTWEQWLGYDLTQFEENLIKDGSFITLNERYKIWFLKRAPVRVKLPVFLKINIHDTENLLEQFFRFHLMRRYFMPSKIFKSILTRVMKWERFKKILTKKYNITAPEILSAGNPDTDNLDEVSLKIKKELKDFFFIFVKNFNLFSRISVDGVMGYIWDLIKYHKYWAANEDFEVEEYFFLKMHEYVRCDPQANAYMSKYQHILWYRYNPIRFYTFNNTNIRLYNIIKLVPYLCITWVFNLVIFCPGVYIHDTRLLWVSLLLLAYILVLKWSLKDQKDLLTGKALYLYKYRTFGLVTIPWRSSVFFKYSLTEEELKALEKAQKTNLGGGILSSVHKHLYYKYKYDAWRLDLVLGNTAWICYFLSGHLTDQKFRYRQYGWDYYPSDKDAPTTDYTKIIWHDDTIPRLGSGWNPMNLLYANKYKGSKKEILLELDSGREGFKLMPKNYYFTYLTESGKKLQASIKVNFGDKLYMQHSAQLERGCSDVKLAGSYWRYIWEPRSSKSVRLNKYIDMLENMITNHYYDFKALMVECRLRMPTFFRVDKEWVNGFTGFKYKKKLLNNCISNIHIKDKEIIKKLDYPYILTEGEKHVNVLFYQSLKWKIHMVECNIKSAAKVAERGIVYIRYTNGRYIPEPVVKDYLLIKAQLEISLNNTGFWITQNFKNVSIDIRLKRFFDFIFKSWNSNNSAYENFLEIRTKLDFVLLNEDLLFLIKSWF